MKKIFLIIILFAGACTKDLHQEHQPIAVIEGYLLPRQPVFVKITWELPWGSNIDTLIPLENLTPVLVQNQTSHTLTYLRDGYYGNPNIRLQEKDSCYLYFEHNGKHVSAYTVIPDKPTGFACNPDTVRYIGGGAFPKYNPAAIEFKWNNPGNDYHLLVIRYPYSEIWWQLPRNPPNWGRGYVYYGKPTKETVSWFRCEDYMWGDGEYTANLYRILPEYAIMFNETHSSSLEMTAPPHNITNGYGIFTGVNQADSITIHAVR